MSRVKFLEITQEDFLNIIKAKNKLKWSDIIKDCRINRRTLFDWRRNKYQMDHTSFLALRNNYDVPKVNIAVLAEHWNVKNAGKRGAIRRNAIYGNPGTPQSRRKGGLASLLKFQTNSALAKKAGFKLSKQIIHPSKSSLLAEFIGIVLGDGSISEYQIRISGNSKSDVSYHSFIKNLITDLFNIDCTIALRTKNTIDVTVSSKNLVKFLLDCGLKKGDKIKQKVSVPKWIFNNKEFVKGCLRGLIDTDGGIYFHNHLTKGIRYKNMGLCFTSHSKPLLDSAHHMFLSLGIDAKNDGKKHVSIYNRLEINKYMQIVGSNNPKHIKRFKSYKTSKV